MKMHKEKILNRNGKKAEGKGIETDKKENRVPKWIKKVKSK